MLYYGNSLKTSFNSKKMGDENLGKMALVTNEHCFFLNIYFANSAEWHIHVCIQIKKHRAFEYNETTKLNWTMESFCWISRRNRPLRIALDVLAISKRKTTVQDRFNGVDIINNKKLSIWQQLGISFMWTRVHNLCVHPELINTTYHK